MSKNYTRAKIIKWLNKDIKAEKLSSLYNEPYVNYNGETSDTNEFYYDVIAGYLLENKIKTLFEGMETITRQSTYKTPGHEAMTEEERELMREQKRKEEWLARSLLGSKFDAIGEIKDYQVPIKNKRSDKAGKVDLLAYNEKKKLLSLFELKREDSEETLLRAVLEICTYYHLIDKEKLISDFGYPAASVQKVVLVSQDSLQHQQYIKSKIIRKLAKELKVKVYVLDKHNQLTELT